MKKGPDDQPSFQLSSDELVDVVNALKEHWEARVGELTPVKKTRKKPIQHFAWYPSALQEDSTAAGPYQPQKK